jgi:GR25 family glycosyltransferase involved in LPS biosynthesis
MNNYFDKIYCINLDKRTDRWSDCQQEFVKHNIIAERFSAVDGKIVDQVPPLLPGQIGCLISQLSVIKMAKESNLSSVMILEDDVEFCDDFSNQFDECMKLVPDNWNMIFLGANHIQKPNKINERIYKLNYSYSAHCYAIRNNMFDPLINILSITKDPLDVVYANIQSSINAYVVNPHLAWQKPGYSDICEEYVDYTHVHKINL